jgi:hypothetical protein
MIGNQTTPEFIEYLNLEVDWVYNLLTKLYPKKEIWKLEQYSIYTLDYKTNRIRIFYDVNNLVTDITIG